MSEERLKILQMLSEGKITVEDAERLLKAIESEGSDARHAEEQGKTWSDFRSTIRNSMRSTIRDSMPDLKRVVVDAMPDVDRIVTQATASIPDLENVFEELTRDMSDAFNKWVKPSESSSTHYHSGFENVAERDLEVSASIVPGSTLTLDNRRGDVSFDTWDKEEVRAAVRVVAHATSPAAAAEYADAVEIEINQTATGETQIEPILPAKSMDGIGPCRLNFKITIPENTNLRLHTAHGTLQIPRLGGIATLRHSHGRTDIGIIAGTVTLDQSHGKTKIGLAGDSVKLKASHGKVEIGQVGGSLDAALSHSRTEIGSVGGAATLEASHSKLSVKSVSDECSVKIEHGPLDVRNVGGTLSVSSSHCPVAVKKVSGNVHAVNSHGPVSLKEIDGNVVCSASHGPVAIQDVGGEVNVKSDHSPISLRRIRVDAAVDSDRGPVSVEEVNGRLAVHGSRAPVTIKDPGGEVLVQSSKGSISLTATRPFDSACTLTSDRGHIRLSLHPASNLDVQGYVVRGSVETDLPLNVTANRESGQSVMGQLGAGGQPLRIEVQRGHLSLTACEEVDD